MDGFISSRAAKRLNSRGNRTLRVHLTTRQQRAADAVRGLLIELTASVDIRQIMEQILDAALRITDADSAVIALFEEDSARAAFIRGFPRNREEFTWTSNMPAEFFGLQHARVQKTPYVIPDTALCSSWMITPDTAWVRSSLGLPIQSREQVLGVLMLDSADVDHFSEDDVDLLENIARCAALALDHSDLLTDLERKVVERTAEQMDAARILDSKARDEKQFHDNLKALHEISILLTSVEDLDDFFLRAVELGIERLGFERAALYLYDPETDHALGTYGTTDDGRLVSKRSVAFRIPKYSILDQAFQSAERFSFSSEITTHVGFQESDVAWYAAGVLLNGTERLGWLVVTSGKEGHEATGPLLETVALYSRTIGTLLAQKRMQTALLRSETAYRVLAENISDLVVRISKTGITYVSPSCQAILGETPESFALTVSYDRFHPDDRAVLKDWLTAFRNNLAQPLEAAIRFEHRAGHYVWLELVGRALRSPDTGAIEEMIISARDITERKLAETTLRTSLERERELNNLKSRFVSMASHEFRTPLAVILSSAEMLTAYRQRMNDSQMDEHLHKIVRQVNYLTSIMNNMLELSRIGARRAGFQPESIDLDAACRAWLNEIAPAPGQSAVDFVCADPPITVLVDSGLMRIAVLNLVANAIQYSDGSAPVNVTLDHDGRGVKLTVKDCGIGIPESDQKHLFEPFHRGENVGNIPGTGLGLSLVKEVIEMHSGTIEFKSVVGVGTTFIVCLPASTKSQ
ncbi:MAG: GAF domain-containing protein [Chloroflexi bacterium]|nr:GAF domain-containing protein [Chloroflexota bacterium]